MLGDNQEVRNKKPRSEEEIQLQGRKEVNNHETKGNYNVTTDLRSSRSRYDKGMELYKSSRVSIFSNGFFRVSGFQVDTEKMQCDCPDYRTRKQTCKHLFAALLFVKNQGMKIIEDLPGFTWVDKVRDMPSSFDKARPEPKDAVEHSSPNGNGVKSEIEA